MLSSKESISLDKLTNKISATIDQLRFKEISPKKMRTKAKTKYESQRKREMQRKIDERPSPMPQIKGSALWFFGLHLVLHKLPKGTPRIPDNMVTTPNTNGILKLNNRI